MNVEHWQAWVRPHEAGLIVIGVREQDAPSLSWTVAADAPAHVAEYLELRPAPGTETPMLIDPGAVPTLDALRQLAATLVQDYPDGMAGDVLLTFETVEYVPPAPPMDEVGVDLKWSLWTVEQGTWDDYAPGAWERMRAAYAGTGEPLMVRTAPHKEIRYGHVTISKGEAWVTFWAGWDDIAALMDTHGLDPEHDDQRAAVATYFEDGDGFDESGDTVGARLYREVKADSFLGLIEAIDDVELSLLDVETENGAHFEAFCRELRGVADDKETSR